MAQTIDFTNKTALIMGASKGIGLATAEKLAELGAKVILTARSVDKLEKAVLSINSKGGAAKAHVCDVRDYSSVEAAVKYCIDETGQIDFLINNAGVIDPQSHLVDSDPFEWSLAVDINYKGVYYSMRSVLPYMIEAGEGVIVNMSSGAANSALPGWSHYCSTKSGVKKLTEVAHSELHAKNIRVVGLSPGTVATDMMAKIRDAKINAVSNLDWSVHIPPRWAAEAVAFLCGPEGNEFAGTDFSIKTKKGRERVGLPEEYLGEK